MTHSVMLVDADAFNRNFIGELIAMRGWDPVVVQCAEDAILRARECPPDLIIVNVGGANAQAETVVRNARQEPGLAATPIIALTDHPMERDDLKRLHPHYDEWIVMPVSVVEFQDRLNALID